MKRKEVIPAIDKLTDIGRVAIRVNDLTVFNKVTDRLTKAEDALREDEFEYGATYCKDECGKLLLAGYEKFGTDVIASVPGVKPKLVSRYVEA
jgi:hypothetical protein